MLFICGSNNQTTQMHQIAHALPDVRAVFSPFYCDFWQERLRDLGLAEFTVAGRKLRARCMDYLRCNQLEIDLQGKRGPYDLVVTCTDLALPRNVRRQPLLVVQEGMIDQPSWRSALVARARILPSWLAGTTFTGRSGRYDRFCVASEGYRQQFIERGAPAERLVVTGIPNFDDCHSLLDNPLVERGYVLACTSDLRETFQPDRRAAFIRRVCEIADGRPIRFKLHPNERVERARREIARWAPSAIVHAEGPTELMIANCDVLVTQISSVTFVGVVLGKQVHTDLDLNELRRLCPLQNGGRSARLVADECRRLLGLPRNTAPRATAPATEAP